MLWVIIFKIYTEKNYYQITIIVSNTCKNIKSLKNLIILNKNKLERNLVISRNSFIKKNIFVLIQCSLFELKGKKYWIENIFKI